MDVIKPDFKTIFQLYRKRIYKVVFYITYDMHLSEDITQETFIKAYKKLHQLNDLDKLGAWLVRIAINLAYDEVRKRNKLLPVQEIEPDEAINNNPEGIYLEKEENEVLNQLIMELDPDHIHILYLKYYEGQTINKISQVLEIPEGTVKSRLKLIRDILKRKLTKNRIISTKVSLIV